MAVAGRNTQLSRFQVPPFQYHSLEWLGRRRLEGKRSTCVHCHHDRKAHNPLEREPIPKHERTPMVLIHGSKWAGCTYQAGSAVFRATISIARMMSSDLDMEVIDRFAPLVAKNSETRGPSFDVLWRRGEGPAATTVILIFRHALHGDKQDSDYGWGGWSEVKQVAALWPGGLNLSETGLAIHRFAQFYLPHSIILTAY
jgi:hypothetical protein